MKKNILFTLGLAASLSLLVSSCSKENSIKPEDTNRVELISHHSSILVQTSDTLIFMDSDRNPVVEGIKGKNLTLTNLGYNDVKVLLNENVITVKVREF